MTQHKTNQGYVGFKSGLITVQNPSQIPKTLRRLRESNSSRKKKEAISISQYHPNHVYTIHIFFDSERDVERVRDKANIFFSLLFIFHLEIAC